MNESGKVLKSGAKVVKIQCPKLQGKMDRVVAHVGLLSAVSFLLAVKNIPSGAKEIYKHLHLRDIEGTALSALSLALNGGGALDSLITFSNTLAAYGAITAVSRFSMIALPLGLALLGGSILKGGYGAINRGVFYYGLPRKLNQENLAQFKQMLDTKLDAAETEKQGKSETALDRLKKRKIVKLTRHSDPKVVNIMKNLQKTLEANGSDLDTAQKGLSDMKTLVRRRITSDSVGVTANSVMLTTLVLTAVYPIAAPVTMPVVGAGKAVTAMGQHAYDSFLFDKGLKLPEFAKAA